MANLYFYNTLTRKKEKFHPINKKEVTIYSCGPTVYWYQHIGNLKRYVFDDVLKRVLKFNGYEIKDVMNVTDVGHLTSDADEGEDKMEKAALKEGKKAADIANFYLKVFIEDFKKLNIIEPKIWSKATEHIKEQIELVKKLEEKGYTYKTSDGVYFDTSKFKKYADFAKLKIEGLEAGKRIDLGEKRNKTDFALWKFSQEKGKRQQEWKSPWGIGFPGWHIECSAMSMKYLGDTIDIHTGGIDHIPIHHTNEIAQSEAATEKKFVNYWLHSAFLTIKGEKVSKSKGGLFTISELEEKGFFPLSFRYFCLTANYRTQLDFSLDNLQASQNSYQRLKNIISEIKEDNKTNKEYLDKFISAINDDLNTPEALQVLWNMLRDKEAQGKYQTIKEMDKVLGLDLLKQEKINIPKEIQELLDKRQGARDKKDFKLSDELRDKIKALGYTVLDTKEGQKITKA
ncbi:MAG: cysteine--tRNA ligase [Candidatus Nanoarchaeia archaeon]